MHGTIHEFEQLPRVIQRRAAAGARLRRVVPRPAEGTPLVGIIRNPRSHRNKGREPELCDRSNILTATPRTRAELREVLADFAERGIDYLAVDGGDGTVRDVLTSGAGIFAHGWPQLIVLPKGKTNALAVDLGLPNVWSLGQALDAVRTGRTVARRPLTIELPGSDFPRQVQGFILGAGAFTRATHAAQQAHRWGAFNSFAVALTILWALLQIMFSGAGNIWRAGTRMVLRAGRGGTELPHSGRSPRDRRFVLIASTLERFPLGIQLFGPARPGLKLALVDSPLRRLFASMPLILAGWRPRWLERAGVHWVDADEVELELDDRFILDGEFFPAGRYILRQGPLLRFVVP